MLIALSCELKEFVAIIYTKENVAAKALADQLSDLAPPTIKSFGRLIGRMEEGKGEAYASKIDVRCSDRNRIIAHKNVLIATGGSATAEMAMRYSSFGHWISRTWLAFMDESQQYGNYHEIAALAAIQQPTLTVFIGDHRQTPGGLSKGRAAAVNRRKLLQRPLGLRALDKSGDYLPPARMTALIAQLWPDASQDPESDLFSLLRLANKSHSGPWTSTPQDYELPAAPGACASRPNLLPAGCTQQPGCGSSSSPADCHSTQRNLEDLSAPQPLRLQGYVVLTGGVSFSLTAHGVSMLTYQAIVAVRYPELVLHEPNHIYIGHFVPHESTVAQGGFRTVLWKAPKDLRAAVEDVVAFCTYLKNYYRNLQQGATSQLLVLCNRTAVHNLLLQHGFQSAWYGGLRVSTTSSAAGATARIAVIVQTGVGFLSGGRRDATADEREDCYGRATVALTRAIEHTYIVSPLDMAGMIGMAQTLGVYHYGYFTLKGRDIQYHGPSKYPSDKSAILDWGLVDPFISQDKPPLAIAMIVTTNGTRVWRRYRLVVACRDKLRLPPDVLAALESRTRDHVLTTSGFFPCSIDREYLYGYAADGYRSPLSGSVQPIMGPQHLFIDIEATRSFFTWVYRIGSLS